MTRAFTLIELAIVLTIGALLVPMIYVIQRNLEANEWRALAKLDAAGAARAIGEELRRDTRTHTFDRGMELSGPCGRIAYVVDGDNVLMRRADVDCGGDRAIANHVGGIHRRGGLVDVTIVHRLPDGATTHDDIAIGLVAGAAP